jgi:polyhydroxyalkanoate synthesis regulator phasin
MADEADTLVLELLRQMRNDMTDFRTEVRDSLHRVEVRLGVLEQGMASMLALSASDRDELTGLKRRVARIERRLELTDS